MDQLAGLPFCPLRMDKDGRRLDPRAPIAPPDVTDLIVISHGWKNDEAFAVDTLYRELLENVAAAGGGQIGGGARRFGVTGVLWPAFRYKPDLTLIADEVEDASRPARSVGADELDEAVLEAEARGFAEDAQLADVEDFVAKARDAANGGGAANVFVAELRNAMATAAADAETRAEHKRLLKAPGSVLVDELRNGQPIEANRPARGDGEGEAAWTGGLVRRARRVVSGGRAAVAWLLNQATYFEMKTRAGVVGEEVGRLLDVAPLLRVRIHLIGHSFGARLVSAACHAMEQRVASLTLLQGAFSHNALGSRVEQGGEEGAFRAIVTDRKVAGPILVTHTHNDQAVGLLYALASRASGDTARRLVGGADDVFGGIGANGTQSMREGEAAFARPGDPSLRLEPGIVTNVLADEIVADHMDVRNPRVAELVRLAIA